MSRQIKVLLVGYGYKDDQQKVQEERSGERFLDRRKRALFERAFSREEYGRGQDVVLDFFGVPYPKEGLDPQWLYTVVMEEAPDAILVDWQQLPATAVVVIGKQAECLFFTEDKATGHLALRSVWWAHEDYEMTHREYQRADTKGEFSLIAVSKMEQDKNWLTEEQKTLLKKLHPKVPEEVDECQWLNMDSREWEAAVVSKQPELVVFQDVSQLMLRAYNAMLLRRPMEKGEKLTPAERRFRHVSFSTVGGKLKLVEFFLGFRNRAEEK